MAGDAQDEDKRFVVRLGPIDVDVPRTIGFYGGIAAAVAFELIAPELALFVAIVPLVKLLKRRNATVVEGVAAALVEGAAKPVGGDAESTVRPAWIDDEKKKEQKKHHMLERVARQARHGQRASHRAAGMDSARRLP